MPAALRRTCIPAMARRVQRPVIGPACAGAVIGDRRMKAIRAISVLSLFSGCALVFAACQGDAEPPSEARCDEEADCEEGLACASGRCAPCQHHAECASDVCDVYLDSPRGAGRCIPERRVLYVASRGYEPVACEHHPGRGTREDIETLLRLCENMDGKCFCLLGESALVPVRTSIQLFLEDYERHISEGRCPYQLHLAH